MNSNQIFQSSRINQPSEVQHTETSDPVAPIIPAIPAQITVLPTSLELMIHLGLAIVRTAVQAKATLTKAEAEATKAKADLIRAKADLIRARTERINALCGDDQNK